MEIADSSRAWFVDAWAVRDGTAFASHRSPESIEADNTVFLSVPSLQPTPVGRITTALGATRRCFQDRLHDENREEVAFESLTQVRELVRRGYLASGLGPGGAAVPAVPVPPVEPGGVGGSYYEEALTEIEVAGFSWPVEGRLVFDALRPYVGDLGRLVQRFAEATLLEWERAIEGRDERWALREWYLMLARHSVWAEHGDLVDFVSDHDCEVGRDIAMRFEQPPYYWYRGVAAPGVDAPSLGYEEQALLHTAPCPLRSGWYRGIHRLMDKLLLGMADATYFRSNHEVAELAPAVLASVLSLPTRPSVHSLFDDGMQREEVIDHALTWLEGELPSVELPDVAEDLISRYAWQQLDSDER